MVAFWKKIQFWKKPDMLVEGKDYRFIDFENSEITGIELLMPEFLGVVYHYGKAKIAEEGEVGRLQFGYTLVYPGEHDMDTLNSDPKFHTIMGDILSIILIAKANDEARNDNSEKLDLF
jgi:hypothetical protein